MQYGLPVKYVIRPEKGERALLHLTNTDLKMKISIRSIECLKVQARKSD